MGVTLGPRVGPYVFLKETCVRDPAARLLLRVYASGASLGGRPPELARLSAAMSAVAGEALSRVGSAHGGLEREAVEAQEHCGMLLRAGTSMQQAWGCARLASCTSRSI